MNPFFLHRTKQDPEAQPGEHTLVSQAPPNYADEGSEFLNDAIRMVDLPLFSDEESVAAANDTDFS